MNKSDIFWQTYLNLENSLVDLGKYVLISDVSNSDGWRSQLDVFLGWGAKSGLVKPVR